jgi:hypothetical protein
VGHIYGLNGDTINTNRILKKNPPGKLQLENREGMRVKCYCRS